LGTGQPLAFAKPAVRLGRRQLAYRRQLEEKLIEGRYTLESVSTCLCGADATRLMATQDRFGVPVSVVGCPKCGLLRTSPRLAARHLPDFYEAEYHGLHFGVDRPDAKTTLFRRGQGRIIYEISRPWLPERLLRVAEIGAASGAVLRELELAAEQDAQGADVWGCEYSSEFSEAARSLGTDVRHGGLEQLADGPGEPDLVIMSHVLEHFADPSEELAQLRQLTTPQALLYVEVPGILSIHRKPEYAFHFTRYLTLAHLYHFTLDTLTDVMSRAGFERLAGDEEVRAVFRLRGAGHSASAARRDEASVAAGTRLDEISRYLRRLDRSPWLRLRRWVVTARGRVLWLFRTLRRRLTQR
jgi:SAM-dependent methyltransferase